MQTYNEIKTAMRNGEYDGYASSAEILAAICEIFDCDVESQLFNNVWQNGYNSADIDNKKTDEIIELAWSFADADDDELFWGQETIYRKVTLPNGEQFNANVVLEIMDTEICEELDTADHDTIQDFVNAYCERHLEKFGEEFNIN